MSAPIFVIRILSILANGKKEASADDRVEWMLFQDGEPASPVGNCALSDIYAVLEERRLVYSARLVLLLPAEDIVLTRVQVPANQKRHRNKLVPYILEEHLNQAVSEVFFATEWLTKTGDVGVAYLARERLEQWLKIFEAQDLKPDVVFPEHYLLPHQENHCFAIFDQGRVLVRHDSWVASVTPVTFAQEWTGKIVETLRPLPSELQKESIVLQDELKVRLLLDRHDSEAIDISQACQAQLQQYATNYQTVVREHNVQQETEFAHKKESAGLISVEDLAIRPQNTIQVKRLVVAQQVTQVLASEAVRLVTEHHHFQLLQLDFKTSRRKRKSKYNWQVAAGLCAAFLCVQLIYMVFSTHAYDNAYAQLRQENVTTFKAIFPEVKRIRGSLRRALSSQMVTNDVALASAEFLDLMMITGHSFTGAQGLIIQRMAFDASQGSLKIDLQVADYPDLERIQKSIEAQSLQVKIDGANKDKNGVKARLRVSMS